MGELEELSKGLAWCRLRMAINMWNSELPSRPVDRHQLTRSDPTHNINVLLAFIHSNVTIKVMLSQVRLFGSYGPWREFDRHWQWGVGMANSREVATLELAFSIFQAFIYIYLYAYMWSTAFFGRIFSLGVQPINCITKTTRQDMIRWTIEWAQWMCYILS